MCNEITFLKHLIFEIVQESTELRVQTYLLSFKKISMFTNKLFDKPLTSVKRAVVSMPAARFDKLICGENIEQFEKLSIKMKDCPYIYNTIHGCRQPTKKNGKTRANTFFDASRVF